MIPLSKSVVLAKISLFTVVFPLKSVKTNNVQCGLYWPLLVVFLVARRRALFVGFGLVLFSFLLFGDDDVHHHVVMSVGFQLLTQKISTETLQPPPTTTQPTSQRQDPDDNHSNVGSSTKQCSLSTLHSSSSTIKEIDIDRNSVHVLT